MPRDALPQHDVNEARPPTRLEYRGARVSAYNQGFADGEEWGRRTERQCTVERIREADEANATRLREWIAAHRKVCPIMRATAKELFDSLSDENEGTL